MFNKKHYFREPRNKKQTHKIIANCFLVNVSVHVINTISYTNLENERVYIVKSAKKIKAGT